VADVYPDFRAADYASLMVARNLERLAGERGLSQDEADGLAKPAYERVIQRFPASPYAKIATHELQQIERRTRLKGE
jgi:outer membrane protein assembly factor BamD (BamD/ComL family)